MTQRFLLAAALSAALWPCDRLWAATMDLVPETEVARHGLTRPWFARVEVQRGHGRTCHAVLYDGTLYVQTDAAMVHAINAETGATLWSKQVGRPDRPSLTPDANGDLVAVVNGSRLYVLNRFNGEQVYETEVKGAPGAGPVLSSKRAYVPTVNGVVVAYGLQPVAAPAAEPGKGKAEQSDEQKRKAEADRRQNIAIGQKPVPPLFIQSSGRALVQPIVTRDNVGGEYVVWPTDHGYLNFGRIEQQTETVFVLKYRLEAGAPLVGRPAYLPPDPKVTGESGKVYAATTDGTLFAIREEDGSMVWRFTTGDAVLHAPAVVESESHRVHIYATTELGGMYCLSAKGRCLWQTPNVTQFVAASKSRVYALDKTGHLLTLAAFNGALLDSVDISGACTVLANTTTDRIYLISDNGLIQCLRETEQVEPIVHSKARWEAAKAPPEPVKEVERAKPEPKERTAPATPAPTGPKKDKPKKEPKTPKTPKVPKRGKNGAQQPPATPQQPPVGQAPGPGVSGPGVPVPGLPGPGGRRRPGF
jgi:outer membrane protein assembly factor BamB